MGVDGSSTSCPRDSGGVYRPLNTSRLSRRESLALSMKRLFAWNFQSFASRPRANRRGRKLAATPPRQQSSAMAVASNHSCCCALHDIQAQPIVISDVPTDCGCLRPILSSIVNSRKTASLVSTGPKYLPTALVAWPRRGLELYGHLLAQARFSARVAVWADSNLLSCVYPGRLNDRFVTARELVKYMHSKKRSYHAVAKIPEPEDEDKTKGLLRRLIRLVAAVLGGAGFLVSRTRDKDTDWEEAEDTGCPCRFTGMHGLPDELCPRSGPSLADDSSSDEEGTDESMEIRDGDFDLVIVEEASAAVLQDDTSDSDEEVSWEVVDADVEASTGVDPDSWQLIADLDKDDIAAS